MNIDDLVFDFKKAYDEFCNGCKYIKITPGITNYYGIKIEPDLIECPADFDPSSKKCKFNNDYIEICELIKEAIDIAKLCKE